MSKRITFLCLTLTFLFLAIPNFVFAESKVYILKNLAIQNITLASTNHTSPHENLEVLIKELKILIEINDDIATEQFKYKWRNDTEETNHPRLLIAHLSLNPTYVLFALDPIKTGDIIAEDTLENAKRCGIMRFISNMLDLKVFPHYGMKNPINGPFENAELITNDDGKLLLKALRTIKPLEQIVVQQPNGSGKRYIIMREQGDLKPDSDGKIVRHIHSLSDNEIIDSDSSKGIIQSLREQCDPSRTQILKNIIDNNTLFSNNNGTGYAINTQLLEQMIEQQPRTINIAGNLTIIDMEQFCGLGRLF